MPAFPDMAAAFAAAEEAKAKMDAAAAASPTFQTVKKCAEYGMYAGVTIGTAVLIVAVARSAATAIFGSGKS